MQEPRPNQLLLLLVIRCERVEICSAERNDILDSATRRQRLKHRTMIDAISCILGGNDVPPSSHTEQDRASDAKPAGILNHLVKKFNLGSP